jgi:hypothetical protein
MLVNRTIKLSTAPPIVVTIIASFHPQPARPTHQASQLVSSSPQVVPAYNQPFSSGQRFRFCLGLPIQGPIR